MPTIPGVTTYEDSAVTTLSFSFTCEAGDALILFAAIAEAGLGTPGPDTWVQREGPPSTDIFNDEFYYWTRVADGTETSVSLTGLTDDFCNGILVIVEGGTFLHFGQWTPASTPFSSVTTDTESASGANLALEIIGANLSGPTGGPSPSGPVHLQAAGAGPFDDKLDLYGEVVSGTGGGHTYTGGVGDLRGSALILLNVNLAHWTIGRVRF